jgi:hypothetical protein
MGDRETVGRTNKCKRCNSTSVVWQQNKEGRWYLTEVFQALDGSKFTSRTDFHSRYCKHPELHASEQAHRLREEREAQEEHERIVRDRQDTESAEREEYFLNLARMTEAEKRACVEQIDKWMEGYRKNPPTMDYMVEFMREKAAYEAKKVERSFLLAALGEEEADE